MRFTDPDNVLQSIVNHGLIPEDHVEEFVNELKKIQRLWIPIRTLLLS